jgi:hypothetical protein
MSFYIYENWQAGPHKAVLHNGSCGFCNNGQGLAGGSDPKHGTWHGPFPSLNEARVAQERMNVQVRSECRCVPHN